MAFGNAHLDTDGCTCPERNKKMPVRRPWHLGMLTGTWMDAPVWKEIKNAGPSATAFGNAHLDMDGCTCLERNKKIQVCWPWHLGMLTWTWVNAAVWKEIKKCRSISYGIRECSPGHGGMLIWTRVNAAVRK